MIALAFCTITASPVAISAQTVSVVQSRAIAQQAIEQGNLGVAMPIAKALVRRNPNDIQGLLILAAGNIALGQYDLAKLYAKRAYRADSSKGRVNQFAAATIASRALVKQNKHERAKLWMRRAVEAAPNDGLRQKRIREFKQIRAISPWRTNLSFGLQPSDNVNNGTEDSVIMLFGLPFILSNTEPVPGIKASFRVSTDYRLWQNRTNLVQIGADLSHREAIITDQKSTNLKGSQFRHTYLGARLKWSRALPDHNMTIDDTLVVGKTWYGGEQLRDRIGVTRHYSKSLNNARRLTLTLGAAKSFSFSNNNNDASDVFMQAGYTKTIKRAGQFNVSPYISDTQSQSASNAQTTFGTRLNFTPKQSFLKSQVSFSLDIGTRRFDKPAITGVPRVDTYARLTTSLLFMDTTIMGFSPTMSVEIARNRSNIVLNDTKSIGLNFGFNSAF